MSPSKIIKQDALESLNTWHSDKVRGTKVYFADAVSYALNEVIRIAYDQGKKSSPNINKENKDGKKY